MPNLRYSAYIRRVEENGKPIFGLEFCSTDVEKQDLAAQGIFKESIETLRRNPWQFSCQYNNDPLDDDMIEFKREWFQKFERTPELMKTLANCPAILSVDPAFRLKQTNDFTGIVVAKAAPDGLIYILEAKQLKLNAAKLVEEIFRLVDVYSPQKTLIETVSAQILLLDLLRNAMKERNKFFTIDEVKTSTNETKAMRIRSLVPFYANGRVVHAAGLSDLEAQLLEFPRGMHDDIIDALAYIVPFWKSHGKGKTASNSTPYMSLDWFLNQESKPRNRLESLFSDFRKRSK